MCSGLIRRGVCDLDAFVHSILNGLAVVVHGQTVDLQPMQDVAVVGCQLQSVELPVIHDGQSIALRILTNDTIRGRPHQLTEVSGQVDGHDHHGLPEVRFVLQAVFADLEADVAVLVCIAVRGAAGEPAAVVPRQGLIDSDSAVALLSNVGRSADRRLYQ